MELKAMSQSNATGVWKLSKAGNTRWSGSRDLFRTWNRYADDGLPVSDVSEMPERPRFQRCWQSMPPDAVITSDEIKKNYRKRSNSNNDNINKRIYQRRHVSKMKQQIKENKVSFVCC